MCDGAPAVIGSVVDDSDGHTSGSMVVMGAGNNGGTSSPTPSSDQPCAAQWCASNSVPDKSIHRLDTIAYADDHNMPRYMNCNTSEVQDASIFNQAQALERFSYNVHMDYCEAC
jgi:hypothetical protein